MRWDAPYRSALIRRCAPPSLANALHSPAPASGRRNATPLARKRERGFNVHSPRAIIRCTALSIAFSEAVTMFGSMPTPWTTSPFGVLDLDIAARRSRWRRGRRRARDSRGTRTRRRSRACSASTKASIGPLPSPSIVSVEPSALRSTGDQFAVVGARRDHLLLDERHRRVGQEIGPLEQRPDVVARSAPCRRGPSCACAILENSTCSGRGRSRPWSALQDIGDAALAGLAVDADHRLVSRARRPSGRSADRAPGTTDRCASPAPRSLS